MGRDGYGYGHGLTIVSCPLGDRRHERKEKNEALNEWTINRNEDTMYILSLLFVSLLYTPSAKEANVYKLYVAFPASLSFITFPFAFAFSTFSVSLCTVGF